MINQIIYLYGSFDMYFHFLRYRFITLDVKKIAFPHLFELILALYLIPNECLLDYIAQPMDNKQNISNVYENL